MEGIDKAKHACAYSILYSLGQNINGLLALYKYTT